MNHLSAAKLFVASEIFTKKQAAALSAESMESLTRKMGAALGCILVVVAQRRKRGARQASEIPATPGGVLGEEQCARALPDRQTR